MNNCATIKHLQSIAEGYECSLASAAKCALNIIADIQQYGAKQFDIQFLHSVIDPVFKESNTSLFDHLIENTPDCEICAAIKARITAQSLSGSAGQMGLLDE